MAFLSLLFVYIVQRRFNLALGRQVDMLARDLQQWLVTHVPGLQGSGGGLLVLAVLGPSLVLALLFALFGDWLFGAVGLFLQLLVLFLVLGCPWLKQSVDAYLLAWREERYTSAYTEVQGISARLREPAATPAEMHGRVRREFLYQSFSRYFYVIFWFMLLGAPAALFVRLVDQAAENGESGALRDVAGRVNAWLSWIPARLLVGTFALAGNFADCMRRGWRERSASALDVRGLLDEAALGALSSSEPLGAQPTDAEQKPAASSRQQVATIVALRDLLNRSILVWFAVLAALVLLGWL